MQSEVLELQLPSAAALEETHVFEAFFERLVLLVLFLQLLVARQQLLHLLLLLLDLLRQLAQVLLRLVLRCEINYIRLIQHLRGKN